MITGVGLDVVDVARIERLLLRSPEFGARYFSMGEQAACRVARRPAERWALCFAVKEAFVKALGIGVLGGVELCELEVELDERGCVRVRASGSARIVLGERNVWASAAVGGGQAWATVVLS